MSNYQLIESHSKPLPGSNSPVLSVYSAMRVNSPVLSVHVEGHANLPRTGIEPVPFWSGDIHSTSEPYIDMLSVEHFFCLQKHKHVTFCIKK